MTTTTADTAAMHEEPPRSPPTNLDGRVRRIERRLRRMEIIIYVLLGAQVLAGGVPPERVAALLKLLTGGAL